MISALSSELTACKASDDLINPAAQIVVAVVGDKAKP